MFRIGGEEDLLDLPKPGALDARSPASPTQRTERTEPISASAPGDSISPPLGLDTQDPAAAPSPSLGLSGSDAEFAARRIAEDGVRSPPSRRRGREPRAHRRRSAGSRGRSTAPPVHSPRPGLTGWHSWIAWINAGILAVLIVAAVIGHDPPSTTAAGPEPPASPKQAVAQPVASAPASARTPEDTRTAPPHITPKPHVHRHEVLPSHRSLPSVTVQAHQASVTPSNRRSSPLNVQAPPATVGHRVASPAPPDPRSRSTTRTPPRRHQEAKNSQNAAAVEFAP
jgi:hypothetical protein